MTGRFRIPAEQLQKDADGEYIDKETASYWVVFGIAWAESRAALVIEWPYHYDYTNSDVAGAAILDCRAVFDKAVKP